MCHPTGQQNRRGQMEGWTQATEGEELAISVGILDGFENDLELMVDHVPQPRRETKRGELAMARPSGLHTPGIMDDFEGLVLYQRSTTCRQGLHMYS